MVAEHVLGGVGGGLVDRAPVALQPVAGELVKARVLIAGIKFEGVRRPPGAAADQAGDLVAPIGGAHVVPTLALGAERDPVALSEGADSQAVCVLAVALAVALDDRASDLGPAPLGGRLLVLGGHACLRV